MNTDTPRASAVTDEEYQQALTRWAAVQKQCKWAADVLAKAEAHEMAAYKYLKQLRATIAAETLETISGR